MRHLDQLRLADLFTRAFEAAEPNTITYTYKNRPYRVRVVTVTVAEMDTPGGGWTPLPPALTTQLLAHIASGEASRA